MAQWSDTTKHSADSFNGGNQYTKNDQMSIEALNNNIENSLYAVRVAENTKSSVNNPVSYNSQTPTSAEQNQAQKNISLLMAKIWGLMLIVVKTPLVKNLIRQLCVADFVLKGKPSIYFVRRKMERISQKRSFGGSLRNFIKAEIFSLLSLLQ